MGDSRTPNLVADEYGYLAVLCTSLRIFESASRASGRTTRMIGRVQDGDVIVVPSERIAHWIRQRLSDAGKAQVSVHIHDPRRAPMETIGTSRGRVFFDHTWVEHYFADALKRAGGNLAHFHASVSRVWPPTLEPIEPSRLRAEWMARGGR